MNNDFKEQVAHINASPLHKTDREILIKIAKLSLKKGHSFIGQKDLALEILTDLGTGSVPTLQRHLRRLRNAKLLRADINAGENGINHYQVDWDVLKNLPADFRLPPFPKPNDTRESKKERLLKLKEYRRAQAKEDEEDDYVPQIEDGRGLPMHYLNTMVPALVKLKDEIVAVKGIEVYENSYRFLVGWATAMLAESVGFKFDINQIFKIDNSDLVMPRMAGDGGPEYLGMPTEVMASFANDLKEGITPTSPSEATSDPHHPQSRSHHGHITLNVDPTSPSTQATSPSTQATSPSTENITPPSHPHHGHIRPTSRSHHTPITVTSPHTEGDVQSPYSYPQVLTSAAGGCRLDTNTKAKATPEPVSLSSSVDPYLGSPTTTAEPIILSSVEVDSSVIGSRPPSQGTPTSSLSARGEAVSGTVGDNTPKLEFGPYSAEEIRARMTAILIKNGMIKQVATA